ncbi:MAG: sugar phosphate isomerase/epimerase [Myxococcota bacterium]
MLRAMRRFAPGFELYSVRSLLARDFEGTLAALARLGYREVEGSDLFGRSPAEARRVFEGLGLAAPAWHCFLDPENDATLEGAIERAAELGAHFLVAATAKELVGLGPEGVTLRDDLSAAGYQGIAVYLNRAGERAAAAGLRFAYHNHAVELAEVEPGRSGLALLLAETDPARVGFELDLCWTVAGGADPRALFAAHPGRFPLCHAKDTDARAKDTDARGKDLDVGAGTIDFDAILSDAERAGIEHLFVERDEEEDPLRTAERGFAHLARWWSPDGGGRRSGQAGAA